MYMKVVWDPIKAHNNLKNHGIRFSDAELVLWDPNGITIEDAISSETEQRQVTIGFDAIGRILVVIYAYRGEDIRLISARKATKKERKIYEERV